MAARAPGASARLHRVLPFLRWWPLVDRRTTRADLLAGLTGAMLGLPQGVAFAILAGLPPQYGLYAAMVPPVLSALFGSSLHMIAGPTNAVAILIFASLSPLAAPGSPDYISLVLTVAFLTGVFELAMGIARLGALVNFVSHTVIIGFSAGAAVLIASSQIKSFFGIAVPADASFLETLRQLVLQAGHINPYVTAVGVFTLLAGIFARRFVPRIPFMISATVLGALFAWGLSAWFGAAATGIATVGALPSQLPPLSLPDLSLESIRKAAPVALATTILSLTLAVTIGRSLAVKSGQRIDSNQEFIGQGLSNIAGSFFSSYPSAGSMNRSSANYEAGAATPMACVYSSLFLVAIVLLVAPLADHLPLASVAAMLFLIAYSVIDLRQMRAILKTSRPESAVMLVTLFAALFLGLQTAIYAGVLLSLMLFLNQAARPGIRDVKPEPRATTFLLDADTGLPDCPQLKMLRINGSIFFGAVEHVEQALQDVDHANPRQKHLLIAASGINIVDISGAEMLAREARRRTKLGGGLYLHFVKDAVRDFLRRGGYLRDIGEKNLFWPTDDVIDAIYPKLDTEICRGCQARIFRQCKVALPDGEMR
ncbi:MAG: SulP family inorganic anion transporter [Betaproteobacteria bacterium]|nr:SulP family inorganic anion transporter [Betaproteobacteria bacterium]